MAKLALTNKQAKTSISWYISHGFNYADTLLRLKDRFRNVGAIDTDSLYKHYKSTHTRAAQFANYRTSYIVNATSFPSLSTDPSKVRVTVNYDFDNPSINRRVKRNAVLDINTGYTKQELLKVIRQRILDDLNEQYEFRKGLSEAGRRTRGISIVQIEGV